MASIQIFHILFPLGSENRFEKYTMNKCCLEFVWNSPAKFYKAKTDQDEMKGLSSYTSYKEKDASTCRFPPSLPFLQLFSALLDLR